MNKHTMERSRGGEESVKSDNPWACPRGFPLLVLDRKGQGA